MRIYMKKEDLKDIYHFLKENDYIHEDNIIESEVLAPMFLCNDTNSMEYIGSLILLRTEIERRSGLFCKISEGSIRILPADEAVVVASRREDKVQRIRKNTYQTLSNTPLELIQDREDKEKHIHQLNLFFTLNKQNKLTLEKFISIQDNEDEIDDDHTGKLSKIK